MERNIGSWFEIYVDDMDRAKKFYEMVFELELSELPMPEGFGDMQMLAFPMKEGDAPGASGALVKMAGYGAAVGGTIIYMGCEDCANEENRVAPAGGVVFKTKESIGEYGFISLINDPEGNIVGLHSMK